MGKHTQASRSSCLIRSDRALYSIQAYSPGAAAKRALHRQEMGPCIADMIGSAHRAQGYEVHNWNWMVQILCNSHDLVLELEVDFQVADRILSNLDRFLLLEVVAAHWVRPWTPWMVDCSESKLPRNSGDSRSVDKSGSARIWKTSNLG
jgi:hypothetical protein